MSARLTDRRPIASAPMAPAPTASAPIATAPQPPAPPADPPTEEDPSDRSQSWRLRLRAICFQPRLELLEGARVALRHPGLHERRDQLEEPAGLGLHHELDVRPAALVAQDPVAGRAHRPRSRLDARAAPGQAVVGLELLPLECSLHAATFHPVAVDVPPRRLPGLLVRHRLEVVHVLRQTLGV